MINGAISCPHCHRSTVWAGNDHRPFCSERCRLIDLGAWIDESYRLPEKTLQPGGDSEEYNN